MQIQVYDEKGTRIQTEKLPTDNRKLKVGRRSDCDIRLPGDNSISRHHANLFLWNSSAYVECVEPKNYIEVNHVPIQATTEVKVADKIQIGPFSLVVAEDVEAVAPPPAKNRESAAVHQKQNAPVRNVPVKGNDILAYAENKFREEFGDFSILYNEKTIRLIENIHEDVLRRMNWTTKSTQQMNDRVERQKAEQILDSVLNERGHEIPQNLSRQMLRQTMMDQIFGYGPLSRLLASSDITEIMINGPSRIFVEYAVGKASVCFLTEARFFNDQQLNSIIQKIVEPLGRHVDTSSPMVDARLSDGSRVNVIIPPLAIHGASVTIRKFFKQKRTTEDLIKLGSMTEEMSKFLKEAVIARRNIVVAGGTGSGKTTLLNILSQFIPERERVITVEDSAELQLDHQNLVNLEARPANNNGAGRVTIRDLVINTLRMRPDRIIVGECRGPEAFDMLQAMNTGHDGSMTTAHANSPHDVLTRLENMVLMAGFELPSKAIREQIASGVHLIVQQTRMADGSRKITKITEITGCEDGVILMQDIFVFNQTGYNREKREVEGYFTATGNIPTFITDRRESGILTLDMSVFVPKV